MQNALQDAEKLEKEERRSPITLIIGGVVVVSIGLSLWFLLACAGGRACDYRGTITLKMTPAAQGLPQECPHRKDRPEPGGKLHPSGSNHSLGRSGQRWPGEDSVPIAHRGICRFHESNCASGNARRAGCATAALAPGERRLLRFRSTTCVVMEHAATLRARFLLTTPTVK